ncbi:HAD family hydrolase [Nocardia aurantia]|uniref:Acid phosphatase n=1 Tax=Nocardia aurantia TaxID=2585199 RepID=A0A7K0DU74_9NOCA|nr:HAD family hydrolase [Nocardia aurantia]MQY28922.1 hypothetical protein [Nocardia aurantia]
MPTALTSWADGPAESAIVAFVERVTTPGGSDFVEPADRVAVFDNDGTLWCEKPMPIQLDFIIQRLADLAAADPVLRTRQPWQAAGEHDFAWFGAAMVEHYRGDDTNLTLLMNAVTAAFDTLSVEDYQTRVLEFFAHAAHPTLHRPYRGCGYRPMVELLGYLGDRGFTTYIASGGDRDFMRPIAGTLYGVPPERIIGSAVGLTYRDRGEDSDLVYKAAMDFFDEGPEKPIRIWSRIGRRPILAVGNSNGDLPMLSYTSAQHRPTLPILVAHDDTEREFAYTAGAEEVLARAQRLGWTMVSMKNDWLDIFAPA